MPTIVLSDTKSTLSVDQSQFTLRSQGRRYVRIAPTLVERVIVHHGVEISRKALDRLSSLGIPVTFLTREGRVQSRLSPSWRLDASPRIEQSRLWLDPSLRLRMARRFVDAKVCNAAAMLRQHAGNHPNPDLNTVIGQLRKLRPKIASSATIDELMGMEGMAGRYYFGVFRQTLRAEWVEFNGRNRRPPLDPVNAVLSYSYAVLGHEMHAFLEAAGLDPAIAYLHTVNTSRPNLSLDLIEPFRPILGDRLTLRLINLGTLKPEHFETRAPQPGIWITYDGRMAILKEIHDWVNQYDATLEQGMASPQSLMLREVERFVSLAKKGSLDTFVPHYHQSKDADQCPA